MKKPVSFPIDNYREFKNKMLNWAQPFNIFCFLDNSNYNFVAPAFECMLAVGSKKNMEAGAGKTLESLKHFFLTEKDWLFGHMGYDIKNETEQLSSLNDDGIEFPDCHFFVPETVLQLNENELLIYSEDEAQAIFSLIQSHSSFIEQKRAQNLKISNRISQDDYISIIKKLQQHILRGDCYEINYCQEFFAQNAVIDPLSVYDYLVSISPNPFAALYKLNNRYCICASPERYFKKTGNRIYSQPIKGTAKRDLENSELDELNRHH
ncbi:MAG: chorismate-binding protein, partial [Ferruginibacter sp.]